MKFALPLIPALLLAIPVSSRAALLAFDSFSGYSAAALNGQGPAATGFTGNWSGDVNISAAASGLTAITGGYAATGGSATSSGATSTFRSFDTAVTTSMGTASDVWFSVLLRTNHTSGTNTFQLMSSGDPDIIGGIGQRLNGVQIKAQDAAAGTSGATQLNGGGATVIGTGEAFTQNDSGTGLWTANTTYLLVGHVSIDRAGTNPETLQFWKLTDASAFNPAAPFLTSSHDILNTTFTGFTGVRFQGNAAGNIYDELRIGTSFADVVPEPSSGLLGAVAALGLLIRRRSR
jgi:hypothetical protein